MNNEIKIVAPIAVVVVLALSAVIYFAVKSSDGTSAPALATPATNLSDPGQITRSDAHARGAENAKVVVVEFGDFQCPACKAAEATLQTLEQQYAGQSVSFVFRNFPLAMHPNAQLAANAAEAAGDQGKYWEMHDALYANQEEWAETSATAATNHFVDYAKQIGVKDADKFKTAVQNRSFNSIIGRDLADATALQLQGTPSLFVNGKAVDSVTNLDSAIKAGLAE